MKYDMMRTDLRHATGMSLSAFTRFSRGDHMALVVIDIISQKLQCAEIKTQKTFWIEQHGNLENTRRSGHEHCCRQARPTHPHDLRR